MTSHTTARFIFDQKQTQTKKSMEQEDVPPTEEDDVIKSVCRVRVIKEEKACEVQGEVPGGTINNIYR